ncbi:hypothetical protein Tco_0983814 [Tanacetum coccineum]
MHEILMFSGLSALILAFTHGGRGFFNNHSGYDNSFIVRNKLKFSLSSSSSEVRGTSIRFAPTEDNENFHRQGQLVPADKLPSSIGLDLRAQLDGGRMYSGHLEAKRLP